MLEHHNTMTPQFAGETFRMGGRAVDCDGLENRCGGNSTGGSNPSPSATKIRHPVVIPRDVLFCPVPGGFWQRYYQHISSVMPKPPKLPTAIYSAQIPDAGLGLIFMFIYGIIKSKSKGDIICRRFFIQRYQGPQNY